MRPAVAGLVGPAARRRAPGSSSSGSRPTSSTSAGRQGLLGQASGRRKDNVIGWLDERGQDWKDQVQIVAMDPCATYRAAIRQALPSALIAADHFHLVSLANKAVTEVRRRVTLDTTGKRGTAKDPIWAKRTRLLRAKEHLSPDAFSKMWNDLIDNDPSGQILSAWIAKEDVSCRV